MVGVAVEDVFDAIVHLLELGGVVVGGGNTPIEIVLSEYILYFPIGDKGDELAVEYAEVVGGQEALEGACFPDGEDELCEGFVDVGVGAFGFCP